MPKPVTSLPPWASNLNYITGPKIGRPTKVAIPVGVAADGHRPGKDFPTGGQHVNDWLNQVSAWVDWLEDGSALADEDAHVIETAADGLLSVGYAVIGPHSVDNIGLTVVGGGASGAGIDSTGVGIRPGIIATGGATAGAGIDAVQTEVANTTAAVVGRRTSGNGAGGDFSGLGTGAGVEGEGGVTGAGGIFTAGGGSADGVQGEGDQSGGTGDGVQGLSGSAGGAGVRGTGQTSSVAGVIGVNTNTNGRGVEGQSAAAASSSAAAVRGTTGTGDAIAGSFDSTPGDGYAVFAFADTTAPVRAAHRIVPQDDFPSGTPGDGDLFVHSGLQQIVPFVRGNAVWRALMTNANGFAWAAAFAAGPTTNNDDVNFTSAVQAQLPSTGNGAPPQVGTIWCLAFMGVGNNAGTIKNIDVRIRDTTAGADVLPSETFDLAIAGPLVEKTWARFAAYTLPSVGVTRNIEIEFKKDTVGGTGVRVTNAGLLVLGVF